MYGLISTEKMHLINSCLYYKRLKSFHCKNYYNCRSPSNPECPSDNASCPSTSQEYVNTSSPECRDDDSSSTSNISNSSRKTSETRRSKSYDGITLKRNSDRRSKFPKYYRRSSSGTKEYRKSRSPHYKYSSRERKSQSVKRERSSDDYSKYKKRYLRSSKSRRSQTPLRPGGYKPPKHHQRSPPTNRRKSPLRSGEYKPPKHRQTKATEASPTNRRKSPLRPGEYRPKRYRSRSPDKSRSYAVGYLHPAPYGKYDSFPHMMPPCYMPDMFRSNGPILVPHIQYIPVPQPMMPPIRHHTIVRPPKIYNNRPIPILNHPVKNEAPTEKKTDEKKDDSSK